MFSKEIVTSMNYSLFESPRNFYYPATYWMWNDKLHIEDLKNQLKEMSNMGFKNIFIMTYPKEHSPHRTPTYLEPDYFSDEFWQIYREMVLEAKRLGMTIWACDDTGFPSGGSAGHVVRANPSLEWMQIQYSDHSLSQDKKFTVPEDIISAFMYTDDHQIEKLENGQEISFIPDSFVRCFFAQTYSQIHTPKQGIRLIPDLLNEESVKSFISMSLERMYRAVGDEMGTTIPFLFTDESRVMEYPWTYNMDELFYKDKGYHLADVLPALFSTDKEGAGYRIDYYDWWSKRFAQMYFGKIKQWCNDHNALYMGHIDKEDTTEGWFNGFGHILRIFRNIDIPCVDVIWRQIYPEKRGVRVNIDKQTIEYGENHHFPKFASSVVHQKGTRWSGVEVFGVYGAGTDLAMFKFVTDYLFVRGINLIITGNAVQNMDGRYMGIIRPTVSPAICNPINEYMHLYCDYSARITTALSHGDPIIDTAIYMPMRDMWANGVESESPVADYDRMAQVLMENQCDYDIIDDDLIEDENTYVENGYLVAGKMSYRTICMTPHRWMSDKAKKVVQSFIENGGNLVWIGSEQDCPPPEGARKVSWDFLRDALNPLIQVDKYRKDIRVCCRKYDDAMLYFITNESDHPVSTDISFLETHPPFIMDADTGDFRQIQHKKRTEGGWTVTVSLPFAGSLLVRFGKNNMESIPPAVQPCHSIIDLEGNWEYSVVRSYRIGEEHFEVDQPEPEWKPVVLQNMQSIIGEGFSGIIAYRTMFTCTAQEVQIARVLDVGSVDYACTVTLNGSQVGRRGWGPYHFDIEGKCCLGSNELVIEVANTMSNQYCITKNFDKYSIISSYHKMCKKFESESMPWGLLGPVSICSAKQLDD